MNDDRENLDHRNPCQQQQGEGKTELEFIAELHGAVAAFAQGHLTFHDLEGAHEHRKGDVPPDDCQGYVGGHLKNVPPVKSVQQPLVEQALLHESRVTAVIEAEQHAGNQQRRQQHQQVDQNSAQQDGEQAHIIDKPAGGEVVGIVPQPFNIRRLVGALHMGKGKFAPLAHDGAEAGTKIAAAGDRREVIHMIDNSPAVERLGDSEIKGSGTDPAPGESQTDQSFPDAGFGSLLSRGGWLCGFFDSFFFRIALVPLLRFWLIHRIPAGLDIC